MTQPFIVLGDKHSHGGTVTSASTLSSVDGRGIARRNDTVTCPVHGPNHIVDGDDTMIVQGAGVARDGYKTACGAVLVASRTAGSDGN
ncbi:PAAR domain-containing protein [Burkholderia cepacia]|uniref:PAAR domain-containing protein n=1 Tax=Burkholderia cepacia TaxID=292 RepID=UPI000F59BE54|nr:PAAR domain-containing protein [Burkholderia cepacia]RQT48203.1 PAAR domain-containing protein [Burkholderia cepacia]